MTSHNPERETGDVSRETMPYPALPDTVTNPEERAGYQRAAARAAAAYQWSIRTAMRDLIDAHQRAAGEHTEELDAAWHTYDHRAHVAAAVYVSTITLVYNTAVTLGSKP